MIRRVTPQRYTLWFYQDNVAVNQTDVALTVLGDAVRVDYPMVRAGSITGIVVWTSESRTASSATVTTTLDGTGTTPATVIATTSAKLNYKTQGRNMVKFTAGQRIGVDITTTGTWAPITADFIVGVEVEY